MTRIRERLAAIASAKALFGVLCVGLALMLLKDLGWLHTPRAGSICIAAFCLALAVLGLVLALAGSPPDDAGEHPQQ